MHRDRRVRWSISAGDAEADRLDLAVDRRRGPPRPRRRPCRAARAGRARRPRGASRWWTLRSASTAPASSLVPPRSTPITQRRRPSSATIHRLAMADDDEPPLHQSTAPRPRLLAPRGAATARASRLDELRGDDARAAAQAAAPAAPRGATAPSRSGASLGWRRARASAAGSLLSLRAVPRLARRSSRRKVSDAAEGALERRRLPAAPRRTRSSCSAPTRARRAPRSRAPTIGQPSRVGHDHAACASAAASARACRSRATRSSTSPATAATRSTPPTRIGGPALAIKTVEQYLGIDDQPPRRGQLRELPAAHRRARRHHVHRRLRRARKINGGRKNGGYTLRLKPRRAPAQRQAGARARPHPQERAATRARTTSPRARASRRSCRRSRAGCSRPTTFFRLPWVSWEAPKAIRSDMGGPTLLGLFGAVATSGSPPVERAQAVGRRDAARRRRRPRRRRRGEAARGAALPRRLSAPSAASVWHVAA